MTGRLGRLQKEFELQISAFVLMNNHFHLIMLTPKEDIDRVMYFLMKDTTRAIQKRTGRINKIFGGRYKGCIIDNKNYLLAAYKYVYQNPLRAKIVEKAEDYEFSSLNENSRQSLPFQIEEIIPMSLQSSSKLLEYRWINETYSPSETQGIKVGLMKTKFTLSRSNAQKIASVREP